MGDFKLSIERKGKIKVTKSHKEILPWLSMQRSQKIRNGFFNQDLPVIIISNHEIRV